MSAIWYRFRAELRRRWRGWLVLALLAGLAAGTVIALAAGARRTDSAYSRFLEAQDAFDVLVVNYESDGTAVFDFDELEELPQVTDSARAAWNYVSVGSGAPALAPFDGRLGEEINRLEVLEGHAPRSNRAEEIAVSFTVAEDNDLQIGDTVPILEPEFRPGGEFFEVLPPEEQAAIEEFLSSVPLAEFEVVGIVAAPGTFPPQHRSVSCCVFQSQAFAEFGTEGEALAVRLERGTADVDDFRAELEERSGGLGVQALTQHEQAAEVRKSIHVQAVGLRLLAGLVAAVSALIIGQLIYRQALVESEEDPSLAALGMGQRQRVGLGLVRATVVGVVAAGFALVVSVALSPLFPTGLARTAEPDPGVTADEQVLLLGALLTVVALVALAAVPTWLAARRALVGREAGSGRPSRVARGLSRAGGPVPTVVGVNMALTRGRGRTSVPVLSSLGAVTVGLAVLVASLTFAASLQHLLDTPRLYGNVWDLALSNFGSGPPVSGSLSPVVRERDDVIGAAAGAGNTTVEAGSERFDLVGFDPIVGEALPPVLRGRRPSGPDEIALGARTMGDLGVDIGDTLELRASGGERDQLDVVGEVVIPDTSDAAQLGRGGYVTLPTLAALDSDSTASVEEADLYLDLAPGTDPDNVQAELTEEMCGGRAPGEFCDLFPIDLVAPTDIVNFGRARNLPLTLGVVLAVLAAGTLAHVVVTGVRRRRSELAVLMTLGFSRRQVVLTVMSQATILTIIALVIGVPLGLSAGRWLWSLRAGQLGVVSQPQLWPGTLLLVLGAALVLANLIAVVPARSAVRTRPAEVLRSD